MIQGQRYIIKVILLITLLHNLFTQKRMNEQDDVEEDSLEGVLRGKRDDEAEEMASPGDPDEINSFDPSMKTNHYESTGTYICELVGEQRRLKRDKRSDDSMNPEEYVETSLLAFINKSKSLHEKHYPSNLYNDTNNIALKECHTFFSP